jgi:hypothetical protein
MRFDSSDQRFRRRSGTGRLEFHRLRSPRWNKYRLWWYLALLVFVIALLKLLHYF